MATQTHQTAAVQDGRELWVKLQERLAHPQDSDHGGLLVEEECACSTKMQLGASPAQ